MDYSSSSTQFKGLIPFMPQHHQEKEWLPCWSSSTTQIDVQIDQSSNDNANDDKGRGGGGSEGRNNDNDKKEGPIEREHMFDKVVTPSDVGKLNRLVIPKQHAEKYFPLDSSINNNNNNSDQKAGLLLNFEDLSGKSWRFRYSYWNSSQSYVMTKGWSRFVKEKQLSAGDIVSFQRVVGNEDRFFIDWRRRPPDRQNQHLLLRHHHHLGTAYAVPRGVATSWSSGCTPTFLLRSHPYPTPSMPTSIWDHSSSNSSSISTNSQLSQVNMMSTLPYATYGSTNNITNNTTSSVVNSQLSRGSLILFRSSPLLPSIDPNQTPIHHHDVNSHSPLYFSGRGEGGGDHDEERRVYESVPLFPGKVAKRSVRLFGVNVDCPPISIEDQHSGP